MKKRIVLSLLITGIMAANGIVSFAAPKIMPNGEIFDAQYYSAANPDVRTALGTDENTMYQHYNTYGRREGRPAFARSPQPSTGYASPLNLAAVSGGISSGNASTGGTSARSLSAAAHNNALPNGSVVPYSYGGGVSADPASINNAVDAALARAGVSRTNATITKAKKDYDDGRIEYEVEFTSGGMKYDVDVDANGSIISYEIERDSSSRNYSNNTTTNSRTTYSRTSYSDHRGSNNGGGSYNSSSNNNTSSQNNNTGSGNTYSGGGSRSSRSNRSANSGGRSDRSHNSGSRSTHS